MMRSLTLLNEMGDTSLTWPPENDAFMEELIARKMAAGVTFYLVHKKTKQPLKSGKKLENAADARKHRALSIPDADFSKFVLEGKGEAVTIPAAAAIDTVKRATSAKEVAEGHSVGVKPRRGG
jgi:hypothetical protein